MGLLHEQHVLIGDTPHELADAVLRLLRDDALWTALRETGRVKVLDQYAPDRAAATLAELLARLGRAPAAIASRFG